jgi:hypothetical protein
LVTSALLLSLSAACAARAKGPPGPTIADADKLADAACYTCLVRALKIYDTLLTARPSPAATRGAFRTALLLGVREKELGLSASAYLERARELASALPPGESAQLALDVAAALPWDQSALSKEFAEEFIKSRQAAARQVDAWHEQLRLLRADPFFA